MPEDINVLLAQIDFLQEQTRELARTLGDGSGEIIFAEGQRIIALAEAQARLKDLV